VLTRPADGHAEDRAAEAAGALDGQRADGLAAAASSLVPDLRRRLRPACQDWSEADFEALVQRIARIKRRWLDEADAR
jgi:hypothetical protein